MAINGRDETDESIVARVVSGDIESYSDIMIRYEAKLHRYVIYLIHNQAMANDVVQDTFIKAYQNLKGFNNKYKFSSWIYRIAHNEAMNAIKKESHNAGNDVYEISDANYVTQIEDLIDKDILQGNVRGCLDALDPKYREIIQLIYFENMKYDEVGDILHVNTSTVGVWLSRAKVRLKVICKQRGVKR